ncbi:Ldh family oxidoreductase [Hoeflea prorocentri]|uniref:Ldh family oxidoreductase n=1 Tax=Hoeflea prorocentri TaxID=1922333 RepID=A0A9X3ZK45_9HYPH|nr:Ldh family oxidoreductase [Hoeflea prorocentri]MCY6383505.1 Ldh family oxidoreductase [Hoeflea prorocentri]MDA5401305.1 Ldh family oxidoreductase [Hoeflea prorocentri]
MMMTTDDLERLLVEVLTAVGFSRKAAAALSRQTVFSEELGQHSVGVAHVFDYIDGLEAGRIDGAAEPEISDPAPTMIRIDGKGGLPQTGFDMVIDRLVSRAKELGMCAVLQNNATTCGSLGTYALRLSNAGLVCLAATNGPPLLAGSGSTKPVFCTNPMAFSTPQADGPPLLIDQSSSATAYVNIREAAERGEAIPAGWALDRDGKPTTDPKAALMGTLLSYGGSRGANMALMVEVLAAGLTGANWSLDAPSVFEGDQCPASGLFVLAIDPAVIDPDFPKRMSVQIQRLGKDYGVHIPGLAKAENRAHTLCGGIEVDDRAIERLRALTAD